MLDTKRIIQLGLGVAIGMLAYHFIQKAMNKSSLTDETAGFLGTTAGGSCRFMSGNTPVSIPCGEAINNPTSPWNGYSADCTSGGLGGCNVSGPNGMIIQGTIVGGGLAPVRYTRSSNLRPSGSRRLSRTF